MPVPDRLEKRVGEPEIEDVLHRFLAEIVIDPEDRVLGKGAMQCRVERTRRLEIAPERLFGDDACPFGAAGARQMVNRDREGAWRNGEIKERMPGAAEHLPDLREELQFAVVAGHVMEQRYQVRECRFVNRSARRDTVPHALDQL